MRWKGGLTPSDLRQVLGPIYDRYGDAITSFTMDSDIKRLQRYRLTVGMDDGRKAVGYGRSEDEARSSIMETLAKQEPRA